MRALNRKKIVVVVTAMAVGISTGLHAALVPLTEGTTIGSNDTQLYKATESVTIRLSGTAVNGEFGLAAGFYISDGVKVTLDASGVPGVSKVRMTGSLRGNGTLTFGAGVTKVVFGSSTVNYDNILHLTALESAVELEEPLGEFVLTNGVSLVRWPDKRSIANGALLALFGEGLFAEDFALSNYDILLANPSAVNAGATITVPAGRTVYNRGGELTAITDSSSSLSLWTGLAKTFDVNLSLSGGDFCSQARLGQVINGDITGNGNVRMRAAVNSGDALRVNGCVNYEGRLAFTGVGAQAVLLNLASGSSLANVEVLDECTGNGFARITAGTELGEFSLKSIAGRSSSGAPTQFCLKDGGQMEVSGAVSGAISFTADSGSALALVGVALSTADIRVTPDVALSFCGSETGSALTLEGKAGCEAAWSVSGPTGVVAALPSEIKTEVEGAVLKVGGEAVLVASPVGCTLSVMPGAHVSMVFPSGTLAVDVGKDATLTELPSWQAKLGYWGDAMSAGSFSNAAAHIASIDSSAAAPDPDMIYAWRDCRKWRRSNDLRVVKYDTKIAGAYTTKLFPKVVGAGTSFPYVCFPDNNKCRAQFGRIDYVNDDMNVAAHLDDCAVSTKCIIAVFGSQLGGGYGLFHSQSSRFTRQSSLVAPFPSATAPILLDSNWRVGFLSFATNGVPVDPTTTCFSGGWQILTIKRTTPLNIYGVSNPVGAEELNYNGGQQYAELMLFTEMPTDDEILEIETYLSEKWGLPVAKKSVASHTLAAHGSGTIKTRTTTELSASSLFQGTLEQSNGRIVLPCGRLPCAESQIPEDNRLVWVDPSAEGAVVLGGDPTKPLEVSHIYARDAFGPLLTDGSYYFVSPYSQQAVPDQTYCDRRVRFVDGWLDFSAGYGETWANFLYVAKLPHGDGIERLDSDRALSIDVKCGFVVLDSRRGGGTVLSTAAGGKTAPLLERYSVEREKIWNISSTTPRAIDNYLDGQYVDGENRAFNGCREVFSFNAGQAIRWKTFGWGSPYNDGFDNHELFGECIFYSENVAESERAAIEAYLMKKWLGKIRNGFCETREMTLSGLATVAVPDAQHLPKFSADYVGLVELLNTTQEFHLVAGATVAADAITLPGRRLSFASPLTVNITMEKGCASGMYELVSAGDFNAATEIALGKVMRGGRDVTSFVRLVRSNAGLWADFQEPGLLMIVR